jgi:tetratricopeptide (TPR) repeat protein
MVSKPLVIEHHGYADPEELRAKAGRNVRILIEEYERTKSDPVSAVEIADSYTIMERWDEAREWYRRTLATPSCSLRFPAIAGQAWMGLGNIQNRRGAHEEAARSFAQSIRHAPERPDAHYGLAVAQEQAGEPEAAVATLERILTMEPKAGQVGVDFRQTRIKAYMRLGRLLEEHWPERAAAHAERALAACGERPEIRNMAGWIEYRHGRLMDALHRFEESLQIATEGNLDAYIGLCMVYRAAGRGELVGKTLGSIRPLFAHLPRYRAFAELVDPGTVPHDVPEEAVSQEQLDAEREFLLRSYDLA